MGHFEQPELPYALDALVPFLSEEQMKYHYGKHHAAYFNNLNKLVAGKPEAKLTLEELVVTKEGNLFNNAAQAWNHTFFWNCMSPGGGGKPSGKLAEAIDRDFGSFENFSEKFITCATTLFGSGWVWLASDQKTGALELMSLPNADTPLKKGKVALLTVDVWEHAYYIDYRNERGKYVSAFMNKINWPFAENCYKNYKKCQLHLHEDDLHQDAH
ncbi:MAG: superoxide dismutase [Planctomycetaceae bacterium]|nr:superoxide dismutase [Planctomycetaceae bacterium]